MKNKEEKEQSEINSKERKKGIKKRKRQKERI